MPHHSKQYRPPSAPHVSGGSYSPHGRNSRNTTPTMNPYHPLHHQQQQHQDAHQPFYHHHQSRGSTPTSVMMMPPPPGITASMSMPPAINRNPSSGGAPENFSHDKNHLLLLPTIHHQSHPATLQYNHHNPHEHHHPHHQQQQYPWMTVTSMPLQVQQTMPPHSNMSQNIYRVPITPLKDDEATIASSSRSKLIQLVGGDGMGGDGRVGGVTMLPHLPNSSGSRSSMSREEEEEYEGVDNNSLNSSSRTSPPPSSVALGGLHSRSKSFENSHHEIAASVLLLASSLRDDQRNKQIIESNESNSNKRSIPNDDASLDKDGRDKLVQEENDRSSKPVESVASEEDEELEGVSASSSFTGKGSSSSNRPLKKRKKVADIMRNMNDSSNSHPSFHQHHSQQHYNGEQQHQAYHVSPLSGKSSPAEIHCNDDTNTYSSTSGSASDQGRVLTTQSSTCANTTTTLDDPVNENLDTVGTNSANNDDQTFPFTLHTVLSISHDDDIENAATNSTAEADSNNNSNVLQWLPDGKSWKIIRWDALRRQILPQYFPYITSVDTFLSYLTRWGFKEVTDGPEAGSYNHMFFRRGHRDLCSEMKIQNHQTAVKNHDGSVIPAAISDPMKGNNVGIKSSDHNSRSILRVPSLASTSGSVDNTLTAPPKVLLHPHPSTDPVRLLNMRNKLDYSTISAVPVENSPTTHRVNPYAAGWANGGRMMNAGHANNGPYFVNYRAEEMNYSADHQQQQHHINWNYSHRHSSKPSHWIRSNPPSVHSSNDAMGNSRGPTLLSSSSSSPSTLSPMSSPERDGSGVVTRGMPPYSPIRIRSGRGAHRLPIPTGKRTPEIQLHSSTATTTTPSPPIRSFPVSNRGMSRRSLVPPVPINRPVDTTTVASPHHELQILKHLQQHDKPTEFVTDVSSTSNKMMPGMLGGLAAIAAAAAAEQDTLEDERDTTIDETIGSNHSESGGVSIRKSPVNILGEDEIKTAEI